MKVSIYLDQHYTHNNPLALQLTHFGPSGLLSPTSANWSFVLQPGPLWGSLGTTWICFFLPVPRCALFFPAPLSCTVFSRTLSSSTWKDRHKTFRGFELSSIKYILPFLSFCTVRACQHLYKLCWCYHFVETLPTLCFYLIVSFFALFSDEVLGLVYHGVSFWFNGQSWYTYTCTYWQISGNFRSV